MKKFLFITILLISLICLMIAIGFHILRTEHGFVVIPKENLCFVDSFVDVRKWSAKDFMAHSTTVNQYVLVNHYYVPLKEKSSEKWQEMKEGVKETATQAERNFHQWFQKIMADKD